MIKVIGLGAGDACYLTKAAITAIESVDKIYLRTEMHPTLDFIKERCGEVVTFDYLYRESDNFDLVYQKIADELIKLAQFEDITYAVPGNPLVAEKTVSILKEKLTDDQLEIVYGVSFLDLILTKLKIDAVNGLSVIDAADLQNQQMFNRGYMVVMQCYDRILASELKVWLANMIADDEEIIVVNSIGVEKEEKITKMPLYKLDRDAKFDHMTSIVVPLLNKRVDINDMILSVKNDDIAVEIDDELVAMYNSIKKIKDSSTGEFSDEFLEEEISNILTNIIKISSSNKNSYFSMFDIFRRLQ